MRRIAFPCVILTTLCIGCVIPGCGGRPNRDEAATTPTVFDPNSVDGARAFERVRELVAIVPRNSGSAGAEKAARHIASALESMKIETLIDEFEDGPRNRRGVFRNVLGTVHGKGAGLIVIGSHYDTKAGISESFEGANDSGSSTGLLLELARVLSAGPQPECSIMLAFFDGEECVREYSENDGLHGSRRLAGQLKEDGRADNVLGVVIVDMIGDRNLNVELPRNSTPWLCSRVFSAAREEGARASFRLLESAVLDDHVPFLAAGMPAVDIIDFKYGSAAGLNDYWHTEQDTLDKISGNSMQLVGRIVIRMINSLMTSCRPASGL